jgi:hypothetical protein
MNLTPGTHLSFVADGVAAAGARHDRSEATLATPSPYGGVMTDLIALDAAVTHPLVRHGRGIRH